MTDSQAAQVERVFSLAVGLHQSGRWQEAEERYRQILQLSPDHAEALHHLGLLAHQTGRGAEAVALLHRAVSERPGWAEGHYNLGTVLLAQGKLDGAVASFRRAIRSRKDFAEAHLNLGNALLRQGQSAGGVRSLRQAVALAPQSVAAHFNLGNALRETGDAPAAEACYRQALALAPETEDVLLNLALALQDQDRLVEAEGCYRHLLAVARSGQTAARVNLGALLMRLDRNGEAETYFREAIATTEKDGSGDHNGVWEAWGNLGDLKLKNNDLAGAEQCYRSFLTHCPENPDVLSKLGIALHRQGKYEEVIPIYQRALALKPDWPQVMVQLGTALFWTFRGQEALQVIQSALSLDSNCFEAYVALLLIQENMLQLDNRWALQKALELEPGNAELHNKMGQVLARQGFLDMAQEAHDRAAQLDANDIVFADNRLFLKLTDPDISSDQLFQSIVLQNKNINSINEMVVYNNSRDSDRRLRVGFASNSLLLHGNVYYFMGDIFSMFDQYGIDIYVYGDDPFRRAAPWEKYPGVAAWHNTEGMSLDAVDALIRADGIDILIQVLGRAYNNDRSMGFLIRKPAPIQALFHASMTSGLDAVDYFISDARLNPPHSTERMTERVAYLPHLFNFPRDKKAPDVAPSPCLAQGRVSFGFFGSTWKLNSQVIDLWVEILLRVPESRLVIKGPGFAVEAARERPLAGFVARGVDPARIVFLSSTAAEWDHLLSYGEIDLSLDPFPYCGGNSTLESLWMGVPVVTLAGVRFIGRMSQSILHTVGFQDWVASTREAYVDLAVGFALDHERLASCRQTLRARVLASPLVDGRGYARSMARLLRAMWQRYCAGAGA